MEKMRSIKFALVLLGGLFLFGCGSQDRYQVTAPGFGSPVQISDWSNLTRLPAIWNYYNATLTAVVDGEVHLGVFRGLVYKITSTGYSPLPRVFDNSYMRGLMAGPDGRLWISDREGLVLILEDGQWQTEVDLGLSRVVKGMLVDDQGRALVHGALGTLWRRELSGEWIRQDLPDDVHLVHGWCDHGQPPVFISDTSQVVAEGPDGWLVSEPLAQDYSYSGTEIQGNGDGRYAVRLTNRDQFFLDDGDGWQAWDLAASLEHVFWMDNELFAVEMSNREILRWDGQQWIHFLNVEGVENFSPVRSVALGSGRLLILDYGQTLFFDGQTLTPRTPPLGGLNGLVKFEGVDHLFMSKGLHLRWMDGQWQEVGQPLGGDNTIPSTLPILVDDQGKLTFLGENRIVRWNGDDYLDYPVGEVLGKAYTQTDGRVVVFSDTQAGLWAEGDFRWLGPFDENRRDVRGSVLDSEDQLWVLASQHLRLVESQQSSITLTFHGWTPLGITFDSRRGLVCFGANRLITMDGGTVRDLTPVWRSNVTLDPGLVISLIPDDQGGGLLAFDDSRDALLWFDGEQWFAQDYNFWSMMSYGAYFSNNGDGTFLMQSDEEIFLIEPRGAM